MFSCVWLHFKKCFGKYFLVFCCVLENTIENTFSTCCSHFLSFSRLPNEYIISFIPQYRNTNKTQKKNHQIRSNFLTFSHLPNKYIISFIPQNTNKTQKKIIKSGHFARSRSARSALRTIGVVPVMSADDIGELGFGRYRRARLWTISTLSSFFLPLSLSLALSLFCA